MYYWVVMYFYLTSPYLFTLDKNLSKIAGIFLDLQAYTKKILNFNKYLFKYSFK